MNSVSWKKYIVWLVVAVLIIFNGITIFLLVQKNFSANVNPTNDQVTNGNVNSSIDLPDTTTTDNTETVVDNTKGSISVDWNDWPVETSKYEFFDYQTINDLASNDSEIKSNYNNSVDNYFNEYRIYKVGTVAQGSEFSGAAVYDVVYTYSQGPAFPQMFRVIKNDKRLIVLSKASSSVPDGFGKKIFEVNHDLSFANLTTPTSILIPDSSKVLTVAAKEPYRFLTSYDNVEKVFKYDGTHYLYKDNNQGCFLVEAPDGTVREYYFDIAFASKAGEPSQYAGATPYLLDVTWNDGTKNTNEYIFKNFGGCGASGCYHYASYVKNLTPLEAVGKTSDGDPIYDLKDTSMKASSQDADSVLQTMYNQYYPGYDNDTNQLKDKISFESFLKQRPILYWQDPFGKFIEFREAKFLPAAECGKPVIYLYPTKIQDVSVKVTPTGGLTVTEPTYNDGWFVKASPNGEIYNYADGKKYPYLFWEGYALNYQPPQQGFVVKRADVKNFLVDALTKLGLVKNEYDEFIDFWLPKMQDQNYYLISFVPQAEFDQLAPLEVTPKPDTVIRVFMNYQGLTQPLTVAPQALSAPSRQGFTVVEWGGALHR